MLLRLYLDFFKGPSGPKDIEVRFYSNHDDAVSMGQEPADAVTENLQTLLVIPQLLH